LQLPRLKLDLVHIGLADHSPKSIILRGAPCIPIAKYMNTSASIFRQTTV